jgi:hypothetical protein
MPLIPLSLFFGLTIQEQKTIMMHFTTINILTFGLLSLAPGVLGDFHVAWTDSSFSGNGYFFFEACPSNKFNCDCFLFGDGLGSINANGGAPSPPSTFSILNLCGESQMNFYQQDDGSTYVPIL